MQSPREIGKILKEARQRKGVTLENIWNATRIQGKIVEALEEGRADDVLSRVYVTLFLKKYAAFLDLNSRDLVENYKAFYTAPEDQILDIIETKSEEGSAGINIDFRKWVKPALSVALVLLSLFFVTFLGGKAKSFYRARKSVSSRVAKKKVKTKKLPPQPAPFNKQAQKIFPIPKQDKINLALSSVLDVWIKVSVDGKSEFEGTLTKGKKKTFSAANDIKLWAGRAEALNVAINKTSIGKIGKGNVKNITISRQGLKIGRKWLLGAQK
ncbi:MAG: DUF4115 domain-containing protein [Omnitrophica bacterium]|nr:DUF4115 domain-containing protein [Candidatus Omnitrophota bacterium]